MSALADKIRRARESQLEVDGHGFTIRRPTDVEAVAFRDSGVIDIVCRHTVGWDLTELDLIPGGSGAAVEFDPEAFREWVSDQPDVLEAIADELLKLYRAHAEKRGAAEKN